MRNLLIPAAFLFIGIPCFSQINDNSAFFNGNYNREIIRKNNIRTVTISMHSYDSAFAKWVHSFDSSGCLTSMCRYTRSGNLAERFDLKYDLYGGVKQQQNINYETGRYDTVTFSKKYSGTKLVKDSSSLRQVNYQYEYNSRGDIAKIIMLSNVWGKSGKVTQNAYRADGRLDHVKETRFESPLYDSVIFSDRTLHYNRSLRLTREYEHANPGKYGMGNQGSTTYKYNAKGYLIEIRQSRGRSYKITYDDKGLMTTLTTILRMNKNNIELYDTFQYEFNE